MMNKKELQSELDAVFSNFRIATMSTELSAPYGLVDGYSIGVANGKIVWLEPQSEINELVDSLSRGDSGDSDVQIIDGDGQLLTPGLIDCHTHIIHGGNRAKEWEMRLNGRSYEEIAKSGGGILSTVTSTRDASKVQLVESANRRLKNLMREGVTTIEIKSGYGLNVETELKMLEAANQIGSQGSIRVEPTLLGAHATPPEFKDRSDEYVDLVCKEMIPGAKGLCTAVDVFTESIAFDLKQTERVFSAATDAGLQIKIHAEQLTRMGAAMMAAKLGAISADHLEYLSEADCEVLAEHGTVATLLPGAFYCLQETQKPPVAALRKSGVPIAIATDCNPGSSPVSSVLLTANMACNLFGLTPEEALAGITRNAARALRLDDQIGTIEVGKAADFVVWNVDSPAEIVYNLGATPVSQVYFAGKLRGAI